MPIKKIVRVWEKGRLIPENISFLNKKTKNVFFPLTDSSKLIIQDLIDSYQKITCAGIAANQIGYDKSIFIGLANYDDTIDEDEIEKKESRSEEIKPDDINEYADNYEIYINPQIDNVDNKSIQEEVEGCLSIPSISLRIQRFDKIKVRYYNQDGKAVKKSLKGFMSKLFQHELDHLNGKLMIQNDIIEGYLDSESNITPELYYELQELFK